MSVDDFNAGFAFGEARGSIEANQVLAAVRQQGARRYWRRSLRKFSWWWA